MPDEIPHNPNASKRYTTELKIFMVQTTKNHDLISRFKISTVTLHSKYWPIQLDIERYMAVSQILIQVSILQFKTLLDTHIKRKFTKHI